MKRIIIICEGETEREFCTKLLAPIFIEKGIYIQAPLIKKTMGGIIGWEGLTKQIEGHLKNEPNAFVTTLIDYYGLHDNHEFPGWQKSSAIADKNSRMDFLETEMQNSINSSLSHRYIPYIQLHEFEGLLFNNIDVFYSQIPLQDIVGEAELQQTFKDYDNPEMINNNYETCPSRRLKRIIKGYNKILYGHYLAEAIGLENIRNKSPRFNQWLQRIESC